MTSPAPRPHVLFVSRSYPDRNGIGLERRIWRHLLALSRSYDVLLLIVTSDRTETGEPRAVDTSVCRAARVVQVERRTVPWPWGTTGLRLCYELAAGNEGNVLSEQDVRDVAQFLANEPISFVFCSRLRAVPVWQEIRSRLNLADAPQVVDFDDIESAALARAATMTRAQAGLEASAIRWIQVLRLRRFEKRILGRARMVFVCSDVDARSLQRGAPKARVAIIPNSIDVGEPLQDPGEGEAINILFVGTFSYGPNVDAAEYFCLEVLPLIRAGADRPVRVMLVGYRPAERVRALDRIEGVSISANVPDLLPFYRTAHVVVCPIRFGGGTRIKILEAMSYGRAVVSTTIGAEGLNAESGRDILLADTKEDFAGACIRLSQDLELRRTISMLGHTFVRERYDTNRIGNQLLGLIDGEMRDC